VIISDDVRQEAGNKMSYMGVYGNEIGFVELSGGLRQSIMPKLVISTFVQWKENDPPDGWFLQMSFPESPSSRMPLPPPGVALPPADPDTGLVTISFQSVLVPFPLRDGATLKVELVKRGRRRLVSALRCKRTEGPDSTREAGLHG
jgi:hypothetical protein